MIPAVKAGGKDGGKWRAMGGAGRTAKGDDMAEDGPAMTLKKQAEEAIVMLRENVALAAWRSKGVVATHGASFRIALP